MGRTSGLEGADPDLGLPGRTGNPVGGRDLLGVVAVVGDGGAGLALLGCGGARAGGPGVGLEGVVGVPGDAAPLILVGGGGGPVFRGGGGGAGEREGSDGGTAGTVRPGVGGGAGTALAGDPLVAPFAGGGAGTDRAGEVRLGVGGVAGACLTGGGCLPGKEGGVAGAGDDDTAGGLGKPLAGVPLLLLLELSAMKRK